MPAPNLYSRGRGGITNMVKWLKIDKQDKTRRRGKSGKSPFIIFRSGPSGDDRCRTTFSYGLGKTEQNHTK